MLDLLRQLVEINSGTENRDGVWAVQNLFAQGLNKAGFETQWVENPQGASGPLLLAKRGVTTNNPTVTLVGHADTVFEISHPFQRFTLRPDGKTATGPGIIDDKASLLVGLEACRIFFERYPRSPLGIQFVVSPNEETGSPGFHSFFHALSKRTQLVLGLEPTLDNGDIVVERKGGRWYKIDVTGKEAHAGRGHHLGINAGHELCIKLDKLQRLTDYKKGLTVNPGVISGGTKPNVVCDHALVKVDVR